MSIHPLQVRVQEYMLHSRYALIAEVRRQMRLARFPLEIIYEFERRASGNSDDLLTLAREFVEVILPQLQGEKSNDI